MAWGAWSSIGTASVKAAGTSLTNTVINSSPAAGNIVVVSVATDNVATVDGASSTHSSVTDSQGNTYSKLGEYTNTVGGAAGDGVTVSLWITKLATGLTLSVDSITANYSSLTAAAMSCVTATIGAGNTWQQESTANGATADAATTGPTTTLSGFSSIERVYLAVDGRENIAGTYTQDTNFATTQNRGTSGGTGNTNISLHFGLRKLTGTGSTHAGSNTTAADWASLLVAVKEITPSSVTGAAALTGTGTSTVAGFRTRIAAAALTGTGTATIAGTRTRSGAAALTGVGSLTAASSGNTNPRLQTNGIGTVSSNSATTTVLNVPIGSGVVAGDLIVIIGGWAVTGSGTTFTTPTGFTVLSSTTDSGATLVASVGTFYKIADGSEAGTTVALTHSSGARCAAVSAAFTGVTGVFDGSVPTATKDNATTGGTTSQSSPTLSGLTQATDLAVVLLGGKENAATSAVTGFTPPSGYTLAASASSTASAGINGAAAVAYKVKNSTADETSPGWTTDEALHWVSVSVALKASVTGGASVSGAAALTGTGTSTVSGYKSRTGSAALTGVGSSTSAGIRKRLAVAALTGLGSSTTAGYKSKFGVAALTGVGSIGASYSQFTTYLVDTFTRTVASGSWGTPDMGTWSTPNANASGFRTNGSSGLIDYSTTNAYRILSGVNLGAVEFSYDLSFPVSVATTGSMSQYCIIRYQDSSNLIRAVAILGTTGNLILQIQQFLAGTATVLGALGITVASAGTYVANQVWRMKIRQAAGANGQIDAKLWRVGTQEPPYSGSGTTVSSGNYGTTTTGTGTQLSGAAATWTSGDVGIQYNIASGNPSGTVTFDNALLTSGAFTDVAPTAPIQVSPTDGATIDPSRTQQFTWTFQDPDTPSGDHQSAWALRRQATV